MTPKDKTGLPPIETTQIQQFPQRDAKFPDLTFSLTLKKIPPSLIFPDCGNPVNHLDV